jgi:hypothetical protein
MVQPQRQQTKLGRQARLFGFLAVAAVTISLISVAAQLVSTAAPLWRGGPIGDTILRVAKQTVLSAPALFYVVGLWRARLVFRRIGRGEIFIRPNSLGLIAIGWSLLTGALWAIAVSGLAPVAPDQSVDQLLRSTEFGASDLALAALGLALIMIGRVMNTAATLKAENDGFV